MENLTIMPKWNELLLPVIRYYGDGEPHHNKTAKIEISNSLNLTDELRHEANSKHRDNKIENRVGWALSALKIAGLLEQYERGYFRITASGKQLLKELPAIFDEKFLLNNYPQYKENAERNKMNYRNKSKDKDVNTCDLGINVTDYPPTERIENAIKELDSQLSAELLKKAHTINPYIFENVVADLLTRMGYGDLTVTEKSGDGGIDAVVNEDKLGLDKIFVQVKRYAEDNLVTEKQVRDFLGALSAHKVQKGIFVTTSSFCKKAKETAEKSDKKIRLLEKDELAKLMIEYGVGTTTTRSYDVKIFDEDYFDNL